MLWPRKPRQEYNKLSDLASAQNHDGGKGSIQFIACSAFVLGIPQM